LTFRPSTAKILESGLAQRAVFICHEKAGVPMGFVQSSAVIQVEMSVSRYRPFPKDGMVEVWGHVGDYEVCVHLPLEEARSQGLLGKQRRRAAARGENQP
jgi:hypothetical protein